MTFQEIRKKEGQISGLVALERALPFSLRSMSKKFLLLVAPFIFILVYTLEEQSYIPVSFIYALMLVIVALWLVIFMLDCFYDAHYFRGTHFTIPEWGVDQKGEVIPYEILEIVSHTPDEDLTFGFLRSKAGHDIMFRLNVSPEEVERFISSGRDRVNANSVTFTDPISLENFAAGVVYSDKSLSDFLRGQDVTRGDFLAVARWVSERYQHKKEIFRWWGRDSLGRIRGLGKDWNYGDTSALGRYTLPAKPEDNELLYRKEIDELEKILSRRKRWAMVVGSEMNKATAVVSGLAKRIEDGTVLPSLEHKRLIVLNVGLVAGASVVEGQFESFITQIFNHAVSAGHVILVINDIATLASQAKKHGVNVKELIEPFLNSLTIVALAEQESLSLEIKSDLGFIGYFEKVNIEAENKNIIIRALESKVFHFERRNKIYFSYQALRAIVEIADAKYPKIEADTEAFKIFNNLLPKLVKNKIKKVTVEDVMRLT